MRTKYDQFYTHEMEESFHGEPKTCVKELFNRLEEKRNIEGDEIRVLDIAAGDGRHTVPAAQKGFFVDCIEKSEGGVQILNRRLESQNAKNYVNVECGDMLDFGFDLSVYDAVIFIDAIHNITTIPIGNYVKQIQDSTKDNGENIITFLTDVKLDGENYPERLIISSLEAKALLTDLYKEWDIHFLPDKKLCFYTDEVNKKNCLFSATRISMIAKKI
ncbi:class I SAM-dependent methyltransferase [Bacillus cereus]|uniref:class I SAM-dependent methyltransferase n=1 Tax=Bacillus cereus TaxID=1396 RepID=UPI0035CAB6E9